MGNGVPGIREKDIWLPALPIVGQKGYHYFIPNGNGTDRDEYIWDGFQFVFIGRRVLSVRKSYQCGENINSHTPVALIGNMLYRMNYSNMLHQYVFLGFSFTSGVLGQNIEVEDILITLNGWGLLPNTNYLCGLNGALITENSQVNTFRKIIGFSQDSNTMLIYKNYDSTIINN